MAHAVRRAFGRLVLNIHKNSLNIIAMLVSSKKYINKESIFYKLGLLIRNDRIIMLTGSECAVRVFGDPQYQSARHASYIII